jgi:hypothetical protein
VNIEAELRHLAEWWIHNPEKRKKNVGRFLANCLSRADSRAAENNGQRAKAGYTPARTDTKQYERLAKHYE